MNTCSMLSFTAVASLGLCIAGVVQADETLNPGSHACDFRAIPDFGRPCNGGPFVGALADGIVGTSKVVGLTDYSARFRAHSLLAL